MINKRLKYDMIATNSNERKIYSSLSAMRRKYILPFLVAIIILIISEYLFLQEIYGNTNTAILLLTSGGIILSIAFIVSLIRKYN